MTCIFKVVLSNIIVVYILLDFCTACEPASNFCDIEKWSNWSACNATCGTGVQKRQKIMCCQSKPLLTCLSTCNITSSWWQTNAVEFKACGICKNGGVFDTTRNRCKCPIGFVGSCCNDFSVCGLRPCQHGSKCTTNGQGYSCTCTPGYDGFNCQIDIDECVSNPCQNGGSCRDHTNKYSCSCISGYTGINCQTDTVKTTVKSKTTTIPTMTATSEVTNTETPTTAAPTISVTQTGTLPSTIETSTISVTQTGTLPSTTETSTISVTQTGTLPSTIETSTISVTQTDTLPSTIETSTISVTQTGTLPSTIETSTISVTQTDTLPSTIETSTISVTQTGTLPSTIETSTISVTRTIPALPTNTTQTMDSIQRTASSTISFQTMTATIQAINASKSEITMPSTITIKSRTMSKAITVQNGTSTDAFIQTSSILPVTTITQNSKIPQTSISTARTNHTASKTTPIVTSSSIISTTFEPNTKKEVINITHSATGSLTQTAQNTTDISTINGTIHGKTITPLSKFVPTNITTPKTSTATNTKDLTAATLHLNSVMTSKYVSTINSKTTHSKYVSNTSTKPTSSKSVSTTKVKTTPSKSSSSIHFKTISFKSVSTICSKITPSKYVSTINSKTTSSKSVSTISLKATPFKTTTKLTTRSPFVSASIISRTLGQTTQTAIQSTGTYPKTTNKKLTLSGTSNKTKTPTKPLLISKSLKIFPTKIPTTKRNTFTSMVILSPVKASLATTLPTKSQTVIRKKVSTSKSLPLRETGKLRTSNQATTFNLRTYSAPATHKRPTIIGTQMRTSPTSINFLSITTSNTPILKSTTKTYKSTTVTASPTITTLPLINSLSMKTSNTPTSQTTTKKHKRTTIPVIVMKTIQTTLKVRSRMTLTIPTSTVKPTRIARSTTEHRTNIVSKKRTGKIKKPRWHTTTVKMMPRTYKSESKYGSSFAIAVTSVGALILFLMCGFAIWNIIKVFSRASELAKIKPFKEKTNDRSLISD